MDFVIDVPFILAVVAFFKNRFNLRGDSVLFVAFLAVLLVSFTPDIIHAFPQAVPYLERIIQLGKLFFMAPGLYDLAVDFQEKQIKG